MRCLIFDMWGTLIHPVDDDAYYRLRVRELLNLVDEPVDEEVALKVYLKVRDELDAYRRYTLNEIPAITEIRMLFKSLGIRENVSDEELLKAYSTPFIELTRFSGDVIREVSGMRLGVLSNSPYHRMVVDKLRVEGVLHLIDAVVTSENLGRRKPSPEPFKAILESLGCQSWESLMVGDSDDDSCGAWGVGMRSVRLGQGRCGDYFIKSLDELLRVIT